MTHDTHPHDIREYDDTLHREAVIRLWRAAFNYGTAHNEPGVAIDRKLAVGDGLLFVAVDEAGGVQGTAMAGYDGHRGWLYSVAVDAGWRGRGVGAALVRHAEAALTTLGCMKINLQISGGNEVVTAFYERLGYVAEPRVSMGKVMSVNVPATSLHRPGA